MSLPPPRPYLPPFQNEDEKNLKLLSILHYVLGGLSCFGALFPLIYVGMGAVFLNVPDVIKEQPGQTPMPAGLAWFLIALGLFGFLVCVTIGICTILSGRKLARRTHYRFAFVVACIECVFFPLGTILGIFTIVTLSKPSVKALFDNAGGAFPSSTQAGSPHTPPTLPPTV